MIKKHRAVVSEKTSYLAKFGPPIKGRAGDCWVFCAQDFEVGDRIEIEFYFDETLDGYPVVNSVHVVDGDYDWSRGF